MNPGPVFLSYSRADGRPWVEFLSTQLKAHDIPTWWDERDIDPFHDFSSAIERAIEESSHVVVCLTESLASSKDSFVRREIIYAQSWEKPIIPILFPGFLPRSIPTLINHLTWIAYVDSQTFLPQVVHRFLKPSGSPSSPRELPSGAVDPRADRTTDVPGPTSIHRDRNSRERQYLEALYRQVVAFLDATVFSLVPLSTRETSGAVVRREAAALLRMDFVALPVRPTTSEPKGFEETHFGTFTGAFEHFGGRVLLLGEPGSGKTTTLLAFARDAIAGRIEDKRLPLPILGAASSWPPEQAPPLPDWLASLQAEPFREIVLDAMRSDKALLCLDGLDELGSLVVSRDSRGHIRDQYDPRERFIDKIDSQAGRNSVVLTCRVREYGTIRSKVALSGAVQLEPLTDEQLRAYLKTKGSHDSLWQAVNADRALRELVRVPLLLSLFDYAYRDTRGDELLTGGRAPGELRDRIFRAYVERRYGHEKLRRNAPPDHSLETIYRFLGYVGTLDSGNRTDNRISPAYLMAAAKELLPSKAMSRFDSLFRYDKAFQLPRKPLVEASLIDPILIRVLLDVSGGATASILDAEFKILLHQHPELNEWCRTVQEFWHLHGGTLHEAVATARHLHLLLVVGEWGFRFSHLNLRDHFALHYCTQETLGSNIESAIKALANVVHPRAFDTLQSWSFKHINARFALDDQAMKSFREWREAGGNERLWDEVKQLPALRLGYVLNVWSIVNQHHGRARIRDENVDAIARLQQLIVDDCVSVRRESAWVLGEIGDESDAKYLVERLEDSDAQVRSNSLNGLRRLGDTRAAPAIREKLNDPDPWVKWQAERALTEIQRRSRS